MLKLGFGLSFDDLYTGAGLARLDGLTTTHPSLRLESHSLLGVDLVRVYQVGSAISRTKRLYWDLLAKVRQARRRPARQTP